MSIFIGRRPEAAFTRVPNLWARDPKLSLKAKGLLTYLLSHEDGYRLTMEQVIAETKEGKSAVYAAIKELIEHEYLRRSQDRLPGGKVGELHYYVADAPAQTASGFTASRKPESGDDQGKQDASAGETAYRFSASGSSACGKSTTKKTKVLEDQVLEDQNTTSPYPLTTPGSDLVVVDAEIVEEAEESEASPEDQLQDLIDEVKTIRPNWSTTDLRTNLTSALHLVGENFEALGVLARNTAKDPTTAKPSRLTAAGNPHLQQVNAALMIARADAMSDPGPGKPLHPQAHPFRAKAAGSDRCQDCEYPRPNDRHRVGNQGGGYIGQTAAGRTNNQQRGYQPWREPEDQSEYDKPFFPEAS